MYPTMIVSTNRFELDRCVLHCVLPSNALWGGVLLYDVLRAIGVTDDMLDANKLEHAQFLGTRLFFGTFAVINFVCNTSSP